MGSLGTREEKTQEESWVGPTCTQLVQVWNLPRDLGWGGSGPPQASFQAQKSIFLKYDL